METAIVVLLLCNAASIARTVIVSASADPRGVSVTLASSVFTASGAPLSVSCVLLSSPTVAPAAAVAASSPVASASVTLTPPTAATVTARPPIGAAEPRLATTAPGAVSTGGAAAVADTTRLIASAP